MSLADGTSGMPLTPQPKKRRSVLAGVKELEQQLANAREKSAIAHRDFEIARERLATAATEAQALERAYNLVKPQPRQRKGAK